MEADKFSSIAGRYDLANSVLSFGRHRRWKKRLVEAAGIQSGERILDLCSGTGDVAVLAAEKWGTAEVTAGDISEKMLALAREKARRENLKINFIAADARRLPFAGGSFDAVLISFGVRNVENWETELLPEIKRVLKPNGRVLFLEFLPPRGFLGFFRGFYLSAVPLLGRLVSGEGKPYEYLAESIKKFPDVGSVEKLLANAGFGEIASEKMTFGAVAIFRAKKSGN